MSKKQKLSIVNGVLTVEYPTIGKSVQIVLSDFPQSIQDAAREHGFKQKFGDAESGKSPIEKFNMVNRMVSGMLNGEWELSATPDRSPIILDAVCRIKGLKWTVETKETGEKVYTLSDQKGKKSTNPTPEQIKEWGSNAKVKSVVAQIQAERAAKAAEDVTEELEISLG